MIKNVTIDRDVSVKTFYIPSNYNKTVFKYNSETENEYKEVGVDVGFIIAVTNLSDNEIKINIFTEFGGIRALPYINYIKIENEFSVVGRYNVAVTTKNKEIIDIVNSRVDLILFIYLKY